MKPRGRFDIVCVFADGEYVRIMSRKDRSLPPDEMVAKLREYATRIEEAMQYKKTMHGQLDRIDRAWQE